MKKSASWKVEKFGDVCEFVRGPFGGSLKKEIFVQDGFAVYEQQHAIYNQFDDIRYFINTRKFDEMKRFEVSPGNLIMSCSGTMGKVAIIPSNVKQGIINQALLLIKPSERILNTFIKYWMESDDFQKGLQAFSQGAAIQNVASVKVLKEIPIPIPPLPEQQRIVSLLDETFVGLAQVHANAERNLVNAREVFESVLESIDAEKQPLGNLVNITTGKLNANAAVEDGQYPFFTCAREVYSIDKYAFDCEAILLAGNNASGDFNVKHYKGKFNAYQRTYVITVNAENKIDYRWMYFQLLRSLQELKSKSVGANTKFLKLGMIQEMQIPLPPLEEQRAIVKRLDGLAAETSRLEAVYQSKLEAVEELKKSVLGKAFEGEL